MKPEKPYTAEQWRALSDPVFAAEECADDRYFHRRPGGALVLTVNAGYE